MLENVVDGDVTNAWYNPGAHPIAGATFNVVGLAADERRTLLIVNKGRQLGCVVTISSADAVGGNVKITLKPLAVIAADCFCRMGRLR